jgi:hypothetical protein
MHVRECHRHPGAAADRPRDRGCGLLGVPPDAVTEWPHNCPQPRPLRNPSLRGSWLSSRASTFQAAGHAARRHRTDRTLDRPRADAGSVRTRAVDSACLTGTPRRRGCPPRSIEIIAELAQSQILPIFEPMLAAKLRGDWRWPGKAFGHFSNEPYDRSGGRTAARSYPNRRRGDA